MMNIEVKLKVAKKCFNVWSLEQETTSPIYFSHAEDFFSRHLYGDLVGLHQSSAQEIGQYLKEYMQFVERELQKIHYAENERALAHRKALGF